MLTVSLMEAKRHVKPHLGLLSNPESILVKIVQDHLIKNPAENAAFSLSAPSVVAALLI